MKKVKGSNKVLTPLYILTNTLVENISLAFLNYYNKNKIINLVPVYPASAAAGMTGLSLLRSERSRT